MKGLERIYAEKDYRTYVGSDTRAEAQDTVVFFRSMFLKDRPASSPKRRLDSKRRRR